MSKIKIHKVARFSYKYPVSPEVRVESMDASDMYGGYMANKYIYRLTTTLFGERMTYETSIPSTDEERVLLFLSEMVADDVRQRILKFNK